MSAINPSQIKSKNDHPLASLFFFKTANKRDSLEEADIDLHYTNNKYFTTAKVSPSTSSVVSSSAVSSTNISTSSRPISNLTNG